MLLVVGMDQNCSVFAGTEGDVTAFSVQGILDRTKPSSVYGEFNPKMEKLCFWFIH
jgi:hypothetical protein